MTEKLANHQSVSLKIKTDRPVLKTPYQIKGVLMKQFPKSEIVPMLNGSYRKKYLYPRIQVKILNGCLLYTSPSPRDAHESRMPSSA